MELRSIVVVISLLMPGPVFAGWLEDTVTNAMKRVGERGIDEAVDGAYEHGKEAATQNSTEKRKKKANDDAADGSASSESEEEDVDREREE